MNAKKDEILTCVNEIIKTIEGLPQHVQVLPITHYDFLSLLLLFRIFLELDASDCATESCANKAS